MASLDYAELRTHLVGAACFQYGLRRPDAEDAAQETIVRCLRAERRGQRLHAGFAFVVLRCVIIDWARRASRRDEALPEDRYLPERTQVRSAEAEALASWAPRLPLSLLDERDRVMATLLSEGCALPEIAAELDVRYQAAKSVAYRLRQRLRRLGWPERAVWEPELEPEP